MSDNQSDPTKTFTPLADEARFKRGRGRPKKKPSLTLTVGSLPSIEERIVADPASYEPQVHDKSLTLDARINIERAMRCDPDDKDAAFWLRRAAISIQVLQQFEGTKSVVWQKQDTKYPQTDAELDRELARAKEALAKLRPYVAQNAKSVPTKVEATIEALRPSEES